MPVVPGTYRSEGDSGLEKQKYRLQVCLRSSHSALHPRVPAATQRYRGYTGRATSAQTGGHSAHRGSAPRTGRFSEGSHSSATTSTRLHDRAPSPVLSGQQPGGAPSGDSTASKKRPKDPDTAGSPTKGSSPVTPQGRKTCCPPHAQSFQLAPL